MYDVSVPAVDAPLRSWLRRRPWQPPPRTLAVAMHIRMGDILESVLARSMPRGGGAMPAVEEEALLSLDALLQYSVEGAPQSVPATLAEIEASLRRSGMASERQVQRLIESGRRFPSSLACTMEWAFGVQPPVCESEAHMSFPVRFFARVMEQIMQAVDSNTDGRGMQDVDIEVHITSDATPRWFSALRRALEQPLPGLGLRPRVLVHGDGDGASLLQGEPSEMDLLLFSDVLVVGEGNLGRLAGLLSGGAGKPELVVQAPCSRSGHLGRHGGSLPADLVVVAADQTGDIAEADKAKHTLREILKRKAQGEEL